MKRTPLVRKAPMRRRAKPKPPEERVHPSTVIRVLARDRFCVALQVDPSHACFGRVTMEHVPVLGENGLGVKPPPTEEHLIALCYGANSGGTQPWAEMHREDERRWLKRFYPDTRTMA